MAKHEGEKKRDFNDAVESAAGKALHDAGPGKYVFDSVILGEEAEAGPAPDTVPIRDYKVTLDGPQ